MADIFEQATRAKSRFLTSQGNLSVEDLWDLSLNRLNDLAKGLNKRIKATEEEDFLKEARVPDTEIKLKFQVVLHVLNTKMEEKVARLNAKEKREKKAKLLDALARKQDEAMDNMSAADIEKAIDEL